MSSPDPALPWAIYRSHHLSDPWKHQFFTGSRSILNNWIKEKRPSFNWQQGVDYRKIFIAWVNVKVRCDRPD